MTDFDAQQFLDSLRDEEGPEGVDRAFAALSVQLSEPEYKAAAAAIENLVLHEVTEWVEKDGVAKVKRQIRERANADACDPDAVSGAQTMAQVMLQISNAKGGETSPLVKAFIQAAAKLTDEEYNSLQCVAKPLAAVVDAAAKERAKVKPNPFRPKAPG